MANYVQPDYRIPITDARVGIQIENTGNPLVITTTVPKFAQAGTANPSAIVRDQLKGGPMGKSFRTNADGTVVDT
jgi:hypothetical protein